MSLDYSKLGLLCGIEIHQQLDTHKLFCSCPSVIREEEPDVYAERKMRAVAGELGNIDPAALHEFLRGRTLVYEAYDDTNCLVELDEEPPHPINDDAVNIVLKVALMLKANIVDEFHVMRKTVIDGSNTSGFQRTVLVAMGGIIDTSEGPVRIPTICLEEDAARKTLDEGGKIHYRLDRLGIPLIEIATDPDIISPAHAKETAKKIGMILRATGQVRRGLGTIRQDINVSIKEGKRIEVKGVQDLKLIPKLVENEVKRQVGLVEIKKELEKRGSAPFDKTFEVVEIKAGEANKASTSPRDYTQTQKGRIKKAPFGDITDLFLEDNRDWIKSRIKSGEKVLGIRIPQFAGLLGKELMPDHRFSTELAHVVKASTGLKGILHSDEEANQNIAKKIADKLGCDSQDAWVAVIGDIKTAADAVLPVFSRCKAAFSGVPKETRKALEDGRTAYMRPLPGSDRMYPETDEIPIVASNVDSLKSRLPELPQQTVKRFEKLGLVSELAWQVVRSNNADLITEMVRDYPNVKPSVIATTILSTGKEVKRRHNVDTEKLEDTHFRQIIRILNRGIISKDVIEELMIGIVESPDKKVDQIVKEKNLAVMDEKELEKIVSKVLKGNSDIINSMGEKAVNHMLGKVMAEVGGRAKPEEVRRTLSSMIK